MSSSNSAEQSRQLYSYSGIVYPPSSIFSCQPILAKSMFTRPLSRAQVREVDRRAIDEYGMTGLVLMENAGRGCAQTLLDIGCNGAVVIVCGRGNNAGDGFVIARHLDIQAATVKVILLAAASDLRGDAASNYAILSRCDVPMIDLSARFDGPTFDAQLAGADWIVDALLGTGASGPPRPPLNTAIEHMNAARARRLAVDLPSGLDCDTGEPADPTFRADHTCTFVTPKSGFTNPHAVPFLGHVHVIDIGVPRRLIEEIAGDKV
jgi:NAD(P)H-hydrate epimerase